MANANHPLQIHFNAGIVDQLASWLETVAANLLQKALDQEQPTIDDLLPPGWHSYLEQLAKQYPGQDSLPLPHQAFSNAVKETIKNPSQDFSVWRGQAVAEIKQLLHVNPLYCLPEDIWPLIETRAWRNPVFLSDVAQRLEKSFRQRVLFALGEFITFELHSRTFWILIMMACLGIQEEPKGIIARILRWWRRWMGQPAPEPSFEQRWRDHLRTLGEKYGLSDSHWASGWDQWVLLEAYEHWNSDEYPTWLEGMLTDLPLRQGDSVNSVSSPSEPRSLAEDAISLAHPQWQDNIPDWFKVWRNKTIVIPQRNE